MKIDTSTTAGKIKVMQAFENGSVIVGRPFSSGVVINFERARLSEPVLWNWDYYVYYIKPETVEEASKDYAEKTDLTVYKILVDAFEAGAKWREENPKDGS